MQGYEYSKACFELPLGWATTWHTQFLRTLNFDFETLIDFEPKWQQWVVYPKDVYIPWIKYWVKGANTNVPTPEPQTDIPVAKDLKLKNKFPSTEYIFNFFL